MSGSWGRLARAQRPNHVAERVDFVVADAASLPYGPGSFDLITLINVSPFVEELVRVLRKGERVIVADSFGPPTPSTYPAMRCAGLLRAEGSRSSPTARQLRVRSWWDGAELTPIGPHGKSATSTTP
jgi:SAM-dependent methyltransferase